MNYQRFIQQLPKLYENWGQSSVHPKSEQFQRVLEQVKGKTTANGMQLLNLAVECMEADEVYCEVGCSSGGNLIGALLNHPSQMAYAVENFAESDAEEKNLEQLSHNLSLFNLEQQVFFCQQDFEEFFFDLREIQSKDKIGVYFYNGDPDYRSQLLALLLVKPFLAQKALIIVGDSNWSGVQQANWDFMAAHPHCQLLLDLPTPKDGHHTFGHGFQVLSWDVHQEASYSWSEFAERFRHEPFIESLPEFQREFEFIQKKKAINSLYKEALAMSWSKNFKGAEKKYKKILEWERNYTPAWHNLGLIYYEGALYEYALEAVGKALKIDPSVGNYHYSLGLVLEKLSKTSQAIAAYQQAIKLKPHHIDAYNNLGNIFYTSGELERASSIYRQAIAANPEHFGSYVNLGNVLKEKYQFGQAIEVYEKALQLRPQDPNILHNLGLAFEAKHEGAKSALYFGYSAYSQGKYEGAIVQLQKFLSTQTGDAGVYVALAICYKNLNQQEEAIKAYQEGIKHYPTEPELYFGLIITLQDFGRTQEAITTASEASRLFPNELALKLEKQRLVPILYDTPEEIYFYRSRFTQYLENLVQQTALDSPEQRKNALKGIGRNTNFFLQYQGKNDLELQRRYGEFIHRVMAANYPEWSRIMPMPELSPGGKIRVGYISPCLNGHTVGKLLLGWLRNHDPEKFDIYCYYGEPQVDSTTEQFKVYSHVFHHIPNDLLATCKQIIADQLHVLVFVDIGMHPKITQIAGLRLAPVQCTTWLHPVTSGIPTIDYFLSSELMEPENAQEHYSEKLIILPKIGISYSKPILPPTRENRSKFQLREQAVVYLCCQSLSKYLPQYDYIFATIAQRVPQAQFAFISSPIGNSITERFRHRLKKAFARFNLNSEEYCTFLPRINRGDYLKLNLVSDIFLDTFSWSGGHTTLEAIACNLPVVTCPGEFMRGRHSYGILKMLGVTDTIAKDEAEYIDIAVRLGLDQQWRQSIVQRIEANHSRLYDDLSCVKALEEFYQRVVGEY